MTVSEEIDAVFLIADLSGYTALTEAHGNLSAAQ
jgi:class 3 adenylate cyclase